MCVMVASSVQWYMSANVRMFLNKHEDDTGSNSKKRAVTMTINATMVLVMMTTTCKEVSVDCANAGHMVEIRTSQ